MSQALSGPTQCSACISSLLLTQLGPLLLILQNSAPGTPLPGSLSSFPRRNQTSPLASQNLTHITALITQDTLGTCFVVSHLGFLLNCELLEGWAGGRTAGTPKAESGGNSKSRVPAAPPHSLLNDCEQWTTLHPAGKDKQSLQVPLPGKSSHLSAQCSPRTTVVPLR